MTTRLSVANLRVSFGSRTVLDIVELDCEGGELLVVLGGAGSGKSAFGGALAGSLPSRGQVALDGRPLDGPPSQRRRRGLAAALRDGGSISGCTVAEAMRIAARGSRRFDEAMDRLPQLATRRSVMAQMLSGGEQQLLRVAAAWCAAPRVLVLDAPTVGLAGGAAESVIALAREEAERGATVVWLEQDARAAPAPPSVTLEHGRISRVKQEESGAASR